MPGHPPPHSVCVCGGGKPSRPTGQHVNQTHVGTLAGPTNCKSLLGDSQGNVTRTRVHSGVMMCSLVTRVLQLFLLKSLIKKKKKALTCQPVRPTGQY